MSDLRERVAKHVFLALQTERDTANKWETSDPETQRTWRIIADAAIALVRAEVLEEAARVVTEHYQELCTEHRLLLVSRAAAIRALKEKTNDRQ